MLHKSVPASTTRPLCGEKPGKEKPPASPSEGAHSEGAVATDIPSSAVASAMQAKRRRGEEWKRVLSGRWLSHTEPFSVGAHEPADLRRHEAAVA